MQFTKATRSTVAPKFAFSGVSGSGKTYSALRFAQGYTDGGRVALIDTENQSASIYSNKFNFDVCDIAPRTFQAAKGTTQNFWWTDFRDAINMAIDAKYDFIILDSASHLWQGVLDFKTRLDTERQGSNSFTNWSQAGQQYSSVINTILQSPIPFLCCFRSKTEYALNRDETTGKTVPVKLGLAPIARDGIDYEFTLVFDIDRQHTAKVSKSRIDDVSDDVGIITEEFGRQVREYFK